MKYIIASMIWVVSFSINAGAEQTHRTDSATGAKTWETNVNGVHFSLTQILPDQINAFYVNRGFSLDQIESYASSCVYMTVLRNDNAPGVIHFVRNNWSILVNNKPHKLVPVSQWVEDLSSIGVKKPALIAFRWAQFPPEQKYEPGGNWNQGMLSIGLPSDSIFDVTAKWDISGKKYEAKLTGVQCAK
jgi:hypothetical protein